MINGFNKSIKEKNEKINKLYIKEKKYIPKNSFKILKVSYIFLILKFFLLLLISLFFILNNIFTNINKEGIIPELINYNNKSLKLLVPSKKCHKLSPRTLYFDSFFKENYNKIENFEINEINLSEQNKKYFVSYYFNIYRGHLKYLKIFENGGMIRSLFKFFDHNLFINAFNRTSYTEMIRNISINKYQKIYEYLNVDDYHDKNLLYKNYKIMKNIFNDDYNFMSETFCYPEDKIIINERFGNYTLNLNDLWLVKPIYFAQGNGIFFFKSLKDIKEKEFILTNYISNPHLINNKKYDLRLYVLISGFKPLRIYLYNEGLVRRASAIYNISLESLENKYIFLTNTAINQHNKDYIFPNNSFDSNANIWCLKTYQKFLKKNNIDYNLIWEKIKDLIIKIVISFQDKILIKNNKKLNLLDINVFTLLGFDILITDKYEPILLEINNKPSIQIYNKVDEPVKMNLFSDTLNIVGIVPFSHKNKFKTLDKIYKFKNNIDELVNNAFCELTRPRGNYELIFPLKENIEKYKKYFIQNNEENIRLWEKIN